MGAAARSVSVEDGDGQEAESPGYREPEFAVRLATSPRPVTRRPASASFAPFCPLLMK